ncbi:hypothetical protein TNCV_1635321 [Trichonephila clavipes]|nr:hypothetical protein TNCV_1635321 [Trichonephila clavipes]
MERNATGRPKHPCDGCPARNIRSLVGDMISLTAEAGFTASAHAENEGVNELLRHCCPFVLQRQSKLPNRYWWNWADHSSPLKDAHMAEESRYKKRGPVIELASKM